MYNSVSKLTQSMNDGATVTKSDLILSDLILSDLMFVILIIL